MFGKKSKNIAQNIETEGITVVNDTSTQDVINESSTAEVKTNQKKMMLLKIIVVISQQIKLT